MVSKCLPCAALSTPQIRSSASREPSHPLGSRPAPVLAADGPSSSHPPTSSGAVVLPLIQMIPVLSQGSIHLSPSSWTAVETQLLLGLLQCSSSHVIHPLASPSTGSLLPHICPGIPSLMSSCIAGLHTGPWRCAMSDSGREGLGVGVCGYGAPVEGVEAPSSARSLAL